ncbi:hypothetical protein ACHAWF_010379 [Thalassiosira exigua]
MASKGSREIEAARRRLTAAKVQAEEAAQTLESSEKTKDSAEKLSESAKAMLKSAAETNKAAKALFITARDMMIKAAKNDGVARSQLLSSQVMMKTATKNSEVARLQLKRTGEEIEEAQAFLEDAEKRWKVIDVDKEEAIDVEISEVVDGDIEAGDGSLSDGRGKKRRKVHRNLGDRSTGAVAVRARPQATSSERRPVLTPDERQQRPNIARKTGRIYLTPAMKNAFREAMLSAIRHPTGKVDEGCLQRAVILGLPKQAILDAAVVARQRDKRDREMRTKLRGQQRALIERDREMRTKLREQRDAMRALIGAQLSTIVDDRQQPVNPPRGNITKGSENV